MAVRGGDNEPDESGYRFSPDQSTMRPEAVDLFTAVVDDVPLSTSVREDTRRGAGLDTIGGKQTRE